MELKRLIAWHVLLDLTVTVKDYHLFLGFALPDTIAKLDLQHKNHSQLMPVETLVHDQLAIIAQRELENQYHVHQEPTTQLQK